MKLIKNLSFRKKLFVYACITSLFTLMIACGSFLVYEVSFFKSDMLKKVTSEGRVIAKSSSSALVFFDQGFGKDVLKGLEVQGHVEAACIYTAEGNVFAEYVRGGGAFEFPEAPEAETHEFGNNYLAVFSDITFEGDKVGSLYIRSNLDEMNKRIRGYVAIVSGVMVVSLLAAMGFSSLVLGYVSRPAIELVKTAKEVSETKDYSIRADKINDDELGALTDAFNQMLDQIESGTASLRENEAMMQAIFNAISGALALVSPEGNLFLINNSGADRFNKTPDEVVGENLEKLYPEYFTPERKAQFREVAESGAPMEHTYEVGDMYYESAIYPVFDDKGKVTKLALYARDISKRVRAEKEKDVLWRQLQQAQKMEAVGQLAGGIAHDFNNMLAVIMMSAEQAQINVEGNEKALKYVNSILAATHRARDLSTKLLTFSRQGSLDIKRVKLASIFEEVVSVLERTFDKKIKIVKKIRDDIYLDADENQIYQSLLNICNNARDAMPGGGNITIECDVMLCSDIPQTNSLFKSVDSHSCCVIKISDTGTGIPHDVVDKIFEPFFTSKDVGKGTGLGLSITHGIIKNHNGSIQVETEPDVGTTFTILLPHSEAPEVQEPPQKRRSDISTAVKGAVLVVDDELSVLDIFTSALEDAGYKTYSTSVAADARSLLEQHKSEIDLVILDVLMPDLNGREVYEILKKSDENIKVIFSSGYSPDQGISELLNSDNIEFIQKPFTLDKLYEKVNKVLS